MSVRRTTSSNPQGSSPHAAEGVRGAYTGRIRRGPMAAEVIQQQYTQIFNRALRDSRITRRARGLLAELASHTDGWGISIAALMKGGPEGRDAIRAALHELEQYGYLHRRQERNSKGQLGEVLYEITDMPSGVLVEADAPWTTPHRPQNRRSEPLSDFPTSAEPTSGNPTHKKTHSSPSEKKTISLPFVPDGQAEGAPVEREERERSASPMKKPPAPPAAASVGAGSQGAEVPAPAPAVSAAGDGSAAVVEAFASGWRAAHGVRPGRAQLAAVAAAAADALESGDAQSWLVEWVVPFMVRRRYLDLALARTHPECPAPARAADPAAKAAAVAAVRARYVGTGL